MLYLNNINNNNNNNNNNNTNGKWTQFIFFNHLLNYT